MKKIQWTNHPNKTTKISAENLNLMQKNMEDAISENWKTIYPIGSLYMSSSSSSPASLFGGTWERLKGGFIYGTESSWGQGNGTGTYTNNHTLTINEIPSHNHTLHLPYMAHATSLGYQNWAMGDNGQSYSSARGSDPIGLTGGDQGHSHNIPYISPFIWRRTA